MPASAGRRPPGRASRTGRRARRRPRRPPRSRRRWLRRAGRRRRCRGGPRAGSRARARRRRRAVSSPPSTRARAPTTAAQMAAELDPSPRDCGQPVGARDLQAGRLAAQRVERRPQRLDDEVALAAREVVRPLAPHPHVQAAPGHPHDDVVVQGQREPGAVEAGPEVGAGRRHADVRGHRAEDGCHAGQASCRERSGRVDSHHSAAYTRTTPPAPASSSRALTWSDSRPKTTWLPAMTRVASV